MAKAVFLLRSTLLLPILCYCPYCVTIAIVATSLYYAKINTLRKTFHLNENQTPQFEIRYSTQIKHIYAYAVHKSNRIAKNKCKHKAFSSPLSNNIHSKRKLRLCFLFSSIASDQWCAPLWSMFLSCKIKSTPCHQTR